MQDVFLLVNFGDRPHASGGLLEAFEGVLRESGLHYSLERSRSISHCHELLQSAYEAGFRTVMVGGGDGTLNVVLNHPLAAQMTLGVLPLGTVNALASSLGLHVREPVEALRLGLRASPVPVVVGRVEHRRFLCFASVGYDAVVVHRTRGWAKRWFGRGAFGVIGLREALRVRRLPRFAYRVDREPASRANLLVVSNIPWYAGATLFSTDVEVQSFQGFAYDAPSVIGLMRLVWNALHGPPDLWIRRVEGARAFSSFQQAVVASRRPLTVQIDGEPYTADNPHRLEFRVDSAPQLFLVPRARGADFS